MKKKKLVCKGNYETWTEFLTFRLFSNVWRKRRQFKDFWLVDLKNWKNWNLLNRDFLLKRMNISSQIFVTSGTKQKYLDWYLEKMLSRKERYLFLQSSTKSFFLLIFFSWMHDLRERKKRKLLYFCIVIQFCYCSYFLYIIQWDQRFEIYNVFNQNPDKA